MGFMMSQGNPAERRATHSPPNVSASMPRIQPLSHSEVSRTSWRAFFAVRKRLRKIGGVLGLNHLASGKVRDGL